MKALLQNIQPVIFPDCQGHGRQGTEKLLQMKGGEGDTTAQCAVWSYIEPWTGLSGTAAEIWRKVSGLDNSVVSVLMSWLC